jgi:hypothetical protein
VRSFSSWVPPMVCKSSYLLSNLFVFGLGYLGKDEFGLIHSVT